MKRFTKHWIGWGIFVLAAGSLWHFVYEWSGETWLVGLFFPVNESTWEHMKLVFFPMAISGGFLTGRFRKEMPGILGSVCAGALVGTWMVPVLFYTYSGILGRDGVGSSNLCFICGGGIFSDPADGGVGRSGKMGRVALFPCNRTGGAVSGVHGFSAGDRAVCSSGIRG